jgi:hypothetical protein
MTRCGLGCWVGKNEELPENEKRRKYLKKKKGRIFKIKTHLSQIQNSGGPSSSSVILLCCVVRGSSLRSSSLWKKF